MYCSLVLSNLEAIRWVGHDVDCLQIFQSKMMIHLFRLMFECNCDGEKLSLLLHNSITPLANPASDHIYCSVSRMFFPHVE